MLTAALFRQIGRRWRPAPRQEQWSGYSPGYKSGTAAQRELFAGEPDRIPRGAPGAIATLRPNPRTDLCYRSALADVLHAR